MYMTLTINLEENKCQFFSAYKHDPEDGHLFFGAVEFTKRTTTALCAFPTLKSYRACVL